MGKPDDARDSIMPITGEPLFASGLALALNVNTLVACEQ